MPISLTLPKTIMMFLTSAKQILLHPLLRPEIVDWDIRHRHDIPEHRQQRYQQAATTPPTESMTLMIPGFAHHLPPIELAHHDSQFITVAQVFRHIRRHLYGYKLPREEANLYGRQRVIAEASCVKRMRKMKYRGLVDEEFYRENLLGIDLLRGHTCFGGLVHQRDARGANIWVVILNLPRTKSPQEKIHPILSAGGLPWDFAEPPRETLRRIDPSGNWLTWEERSVVFKRWPTSFKVTDVFATWIIDIPTHIVWDENRDLTSVGEVLKAIHAAMNSTYGQNKWPFWDADAEMIAKAAYYRRSVKLGKGDTTEENTTYLNTLAENRRRFLGFWHDPERGADSKQQCQTYTMLTQPSLRRVPTLHTVLRPGALDWDIITDPSDFGDFVGSYAPATHPSRRFMPVTIEFMPGESWRVEIYRSRKAEFVTVGQVLFMVYHRLVVEEFNITISKLPPYLMNEILRRAEARDNWNPVDGYKRVDTLRGARFHGLEHRVCPRGEDEWRVRLGRPN